jgi:predicted dehydrogenase
VSKLRIGVIGAGHLGRVHCKLIKMVDGAELVGVSDPFESARKQAAELFAVPTFKNYHDLISNVDAAVVAAPTGLHAEIVNHLLDAGKHVFCEKPLTIKGDDARRLAMTASAQRLTLQVGHVERFNPAFTALGDLATDVKYVEAVRASSFPGRCLDVGVVMDLMIHDLDLILSLAKGPITDVRASGMSVISQHEDLAEARLEFACGLVANVKASRVSPSASRRMQIYGPRGFAEIDFGAPSLASIRTCPTLQDRTFDLHRETDNPLKYRDQLFAERLTCQTTQLESRNAILDELHDFVLSIQTGSRPMVDGHAGAAAVALADQICQAIDSRCWYFEADASGRGPHAMPIRRADQVRRAA